MKLIVIFLIILLFFIKPAEAMPVWSDVQAAAPGLQYSPKANYSFQINWIGSNDSYIISDVLLESNFSGPLNNITTLNNSNTYFLNFTDLAAKTYVYRWLAMDNESNWNSTDQFAYVISKNSSIAIKLYLNGTEANKEYDLNKVANFTTFLMLSDKTIYLNSNYTGFALQSNSTSRITNFTNLTSSGMFSLTAYWNGDENYSESSQTYYFDDIPPLYLTRSEYPSNPTNYNFNSAYTFGSTWYDLNISQVFFESNFSGYFKNYSFSTTPGVQRNNNTFTMFLPSLPAETILYRWICFNGLNKASNSTQYEYDILKGFPIWIEVMPSKTVLKGTKTTVICHSATNQVPPTNFKLYRNMSLISNDTSQIRTDEKTLNEGVYEYVCNNTETQNFTGQTLKVTLNVTLTAPQNVTPPAPLNLTGPSLIQSNVGESVEQEFILGNNLGQSLGNFTPSLTGIDPNWYNISSLPDSIPDDFSLRIKVTFNIPSDAQQGDYNATLRIAGRTSNESKAVTTTFILSVKQPTVETFPPVYSSTLTNELPSGYEFSLKWNDDAGLSGYIFSSNASGIWENDSWIPLSGTEGWSYAMKNETLKPGSVIAWRFYVNDSNNIWTESEELYSTVNGGGDLTTSIIIVSVFVVFLAILILFIAKLRSKPKAPKKEEAVYVYAKDDLK